MPIHSVAGPLVTVAEHQRAGEYDPAFTLVCLACGEGVVGTPAQVAQAERARDAWVEEKRREGVGQ